MLLTCCFRDLKAKKHKKNNYKKSVGDFDQEDAFATSSSKDGHFMFRWPIRKKKENEELRKTQQPYYVTSLPSTSTNSLIKSTDSLTNISRIQHVQKSLPSPPETPLCATNHDGKTFLTDESVLSVTPLLESLTESQKKGSNNGPLLTSTPAVISLSTSTAVTSHVHVHHDESFHKPEIEEINQQEVQRQNEETLEIPATKEDKVLIYEIENEHKKDLEKLRREHSVELEKERTLMKYKLEDEIMRLRRENENLIAKTQLDTTKMVSRLMEQNREQKDKILIEQQENVKNLEMEFKEKERSLIESIKHFEEQEKASKIEKDEVLKEVQKLKDEARKRVSILAMEYEKDPFSENKKKSLTQEVYSLQLVLEMRTGEVRSLREQLAKTLQTLEKAKEEKDKLGKVTARIEDLEEQLRRKTELERQLLEDKKQLEKNILNTNQKAQRMSQNVEQLQWRIKNKCESNFQYVIDETDPLLRDDRPLDPTHANVNVVCGDYVSKNYQTKDVTEAVEIKVDCYIQNVVSDSYDEGLGDISSDELQLILEKRCENQIKKSEIEDENSAKKSIHSAECDKNERRPSRFSVETPL